MIQLLQVVTPYLSIYNIHDRMNLDTETGTGLEFCTWNILLTFSNLLNALLNALNPTRLDHKRLLKIIIEGFFV